jgi:F0F1-type ATP synthase assembly protein I
VPRPVPLDAEESMAFPQVDQPSHSRPQGGGAMNVSIPLVVLAAILAYIAYRYLGLRVWHAIVCALLGFLLAATSVAPQIRSVINAVVQWLQAGGRG